MTRPRRLALIALSKSLYVADEFLYQSVGDASPYPIKPRSYFINIRVLRVLFSEQLVEWGKEASDMRGNGRFVQLTAKGKGLAGKD